MFKISKEFKFDAGHRVYNQNLDDDLSLNSLTKCRFFHGHTYRVIVTLKSKDLYEDMVLDFNNLKIFSKHLNETFDHGFMMYVKDPLLELLIAKIPKVDPYTVYRFDLDDIELEGKLLCVKEFLQSFIICGFNTTAENMAKYFYKWINQNVIEKIKQPNSVMLESVCVYETETSCAIYQED
jgi:6-pyruvoyl-tetrahydropterin synthase